MPADGPRDNAAPVLVWWHAIALGLANGLLTFAAFVHPSLWPVCLVALLPACLAADARKRVRIRAALCFSLGASVFWATSCSWIAAVSALGYLPMVAYLALHHGAAVWLSNLIARRAHARLGVAPAFIILPVVWTAIEYLRGDVLWNGYPWYLVGVPMVRTSPWFWTPAVAGVYAASLWVGMVSGVAADFILRRAKFASAGLGVLVVSAGAMLVAAPGRTEGSQTIRIAAVQTNVPVSNKLAWSAEDRERNFLEMIDMSREAARSDPDLIVWPETMYPGYYLDLILEDGELQAVNDYRPYLLARQDEIDVPMLIGAIGADGLRIVERDGKREIDHDAIYNSAFLVEGGKVGKRYDKIHLTPFGEVMPYISAWPWLEKQMLAFGASGMSFDLNAGTRATVFEVGEPPVRVATPICFEATMFGVCRSLVFNGGERRVDVLVNLTNDGWFGKSDLGRHAHALHARWRAAELGTPLVRAANTGVSVAYDSRGRRVAPLPGSDACSARESGVAVFDIALGIGRPPGPFASGLPGLLCSLAALGGLIAFSVRFPGRGSSAVAASPDQTSQPNANR